MEPNFFNVVLHTAGLPFVARGLGLPSLPVLEASPDVTNGKLEFGSKLTFADMIGCCRRR